MEGDWDLAGIYGRDCYCANQANFSRRDLMQPSENCDYTCTGNEEQPCGGGPEEEIPTNGVPSNVSMTLYGRTLDRALDNPDLIPQLLPGAILWEASGCYRVENTADSTPFSYRNETDANMSPEICIAICKDNNNWKYAIALEDGTCMCSGVLPTEGLQEEIDGEQSECDRPCLGHEYEYCGGTGDDGTGSVRFWINPLVSANVDYVRPPFSFV